MHTNLRKVYMEKRLKWWSMIFMLIREQVSYIPKENHNIIKLRNLQYLLENI